MDQEKELNWLCHVCFNEFRVSTRWINSHVDCPHCKAKVLISPDKTAVPDATPKGSRVKAFFNQEITPLFPVPTISYVKGTCSHCDSNFEFPGHAIGDIIPCPHCQNITILRQKSFSNLPSRIGIFLLVSIVLIVGFVAKMAVAKLVGGGFGRSIAKSVFSQTPPSYEQALMEVSKTINAGLPKEVDSETRLDSVAAGPGKRLTYHFTLINKEADSIDAIALESNLKIQIVNNYRTRPDMASFRQNRVRMDYEYRDRNGLRCLSFSVSPKDF
jgi:DNA-directed RNA polymerase subunit RPC12/RpoP